MNVKSVRCRMHPEPLTEQEYDMIKDDGFMFSFIDWCTGIINPRSNNHVSEPIKSTFRLKDGTVYDKALGLIKQPCIAHMENGKIVDLQRVEYLNRLVSREYIENEGKDSEYDPRKIWKPNLWKP